MKSLIIAASVVVILMVSAIALVIINADDTATASQTETTQPKTETKTPETDVALPEFMDERLQDLVERGFITQEQLDDIESSVRKQRPWHRELPEDFDPEQFRERFREQWPWHRELPEDFDLDHFMGPESGPHGFHFFGGDEDLMDLFGVTPEELMDALDEGIPPMDIIEDPEAFLDTLLGPVEEQLSRAVEEGILTQAEADELIEQARSRAEAFINGEPFEDGQFMGPRGPRDLGGFWRFGEFGPHAGSDVNTAAAGSSA